MLLRSLNGLYLLKCYITLKNFNLSRINIKITMTENAHQYLTYVLWMADIWYSNNVYTIKLIKSKCINFRNHLFFLWSLTLIWMLSGLVINDGIRIGRWSLNLPLNVILIKDASLTIMVACEIWSSAFGHTNSLYGFLRIKSYVFSHVYLPIFMLSKRLFVSENVSVRRNYL